MKKAFLPFCAIAAGFLVCAGCNRPTPETKVPDTKTDDQGAPSTRKEDPEKLRKPVAIAAGLDNPSGVAVQPETGHVFVSMKERVVRLVPGNPYSLSDEIVGFAVDKYGQGPTYELGPLGLAFLGKDTLVVGDGSLPDGEDIVRFYTVGSEPLPKGKPLTVENMKLHSTPIGLGPNSIRGEGNFFGVAVKGNTVFVTCNGDDTKGWIGKVELDAGESSPLQLVPFIKSKVLTGIDAPMGAVISPDGDLVVSQFGRTSERADSLLTFYDPADGALKKKLATDLADLAGIAYSPKTGNLYGVDFSWADPALGGLFLLEIAGTTVHATKIASLEHPTALAFAPDGTLYVAVAGAGKKGDAKKPGLLVKFDSGL